MWTTPYLYGSLGLLKNDRGGGGGDQGFLVKMGGSPYKGVSIEEGISTALH